MIKWYAVRKKNSSTFPIDRTTSSFESEQFCLIPGAWPSERLILRNWRFVRIPRSPQLNSGLMFEMMSIMERFAYSWCVASPKCTHSQLSDYICLRQQTKQTSKWIKYVIIYANASTVCDLEFDLEMFSLQRALDTSEESKRNETKSFFWYPSRSASNICKYNSYRVWKCSHEGFPFDCILWKKNNNEKKKQYYSY